MQVFCTSPGQFIYYHKMNILRLASGELCLVTAVIRVKALQFRGVIFAKKSVASYFDTKFKF